LPAYSPDLSPIEPAFAKLKQAWRKAEARTLDDLYNVIADTLPTITPHDARGFFLDCGYPLADAL
jgi:transposase